MPLHTAQPLHMLGVKTLGSCNWTRQQTRHFGAVDGQG
jgi:hypothetical protein